jgi:4-hydroxy-3-methylbut-2-enyl diphosphate reductase
MEIKLAKTAGFCMGVRRAVDMVLQIAARKEIEPIYTYGPLIHNPQTVDMLRKQGVVPVDDLENIKKGMIIIRTHGISPQEKERIQAKGIKIIDATCPKVVHVQAIIKKHAAQNYTIMIVGDSEHPEVEGLLGHAGGHGIAVGNIDHLEKFHPVEKLCVVAQTTQCKEAYADIAKHIAEKMPGALIFDTICDSTEQRQAEARKLASEMEVVLIIGGHNSANTRRLANISESHGTPTFHIETAGDLKDIRLDRFEKIGISAGASTPNWVIKQIIYALSEIGFHKQAVS